MAIGGNVIIQHVTNCELIRNATIDSTIGPIHVIVSVASVACAVAIMWYWVNH